MLSWIVLLVLVGFLVTCTIHIVASFCQIIMRILHWTPKKQGPIISNINEKDMYEVKG